MVPEISRLISIHFYFLFCMTSLYPRPGRRPFRLVPDQSQSVKVRQPPAVIPAGGAKDVCLEREKEKYAQEWRYLRYEEKTIGEEIRVPEISRLISIHFYFLFCMTSLCPRPG